MEHLNEEQLVLHHYRDDESPMLVDQHLASCAECRGEFDKVRRVLALVDELPTPDRGPAYGEQVWNRLRWRLERRRRRTWQSMLAAAAVLAIAFFAGQLWHSRNTNRGGQPPTAVQVATTAAKPAASADSQQRVLVVVVGDHLESSERMLTEVANANANHSLDIESDRAAELVATNRIYRQTAISKGDKRIASLLSELEPILVELSHAETLTPEELKALQKRIDSQGLLFKVRVVSAETSGRELPLTLQKGTNSL